VTPEPIRDEPIRDEPIERERAKSGVEQRNAVNTDHEALAAALGLDVKNEWLKYNDWKASTGRFHKDPAAGFRNWLRKAAEFKTKTTPSTGKPRQSREDLVAAVCGARSSVLTSTAQVIDITEGESHAVAKRMG
jgi:hypothetical protein